MGKFIIYQLFLRVFANMNENSVCSGSLDLNGSGKFNSVTSTLLEGLKKLSVTHIWYTGVIEHATKTSFEKFGIKPDNPDLVKGEAGSPYAIKDYYDVNPYLADNVTERMKEFEALVERTHQAGLKVIIDFVPNHLARVYCSDSPERKGADFGADDDTSKAFSPQNNFYYIPGCRLDLSRTGCAGESSYTEFPAKATGNDCFSAAPSENDWYETVKLNYGVDYAGGGTKHFLPQPKTWQMMLDILLFWTSKGVDGFRCDMAEMVPVEFWNFAISNVKKYKRESVFIAEVYNPARYAEYIERGGFDYLYDKVGMYDTLRGVSSSQNPNVACDAYIPASRITGCWQSTDAFQHKMLYFLENHDEQRIASDFNLGNPFYAIPELAVALLFNTAPFMLYCGQEIGERGMFSEGFSGLDGRTSIFDYCSSGLMARYFKTLSNNDYKSLENNLLYNAYKELLYLSLSESCFRSGYSYDLNYANEGRPGYDSSRYFAFARYSRKNGEDSGAAARMAVVVADFSQSAKKISVLLPEHLFKLWGIEGGADTVLNVPVNEFGVGIVIK